MSNPIIFNDPRAAIIAALRRELPAYGYEPRIGAAPVPGEVGDWPIPYVQVVSDGKFRNSHLNGWATVRILCYGADSAESEELASVAEAIVLATSDEGLRSCSSIMGPRPSTDVDNNLPFSYFTVTARLRPRMIERTS